MPREIKVIRSLLARRPLLHLYSASGYVTYAASTVRNTVTRQRARLCCPVVRDGSRTVLADNIRVEVHHSLTGDARRDRAHPVRGVTYGTAESLLRHVEVVPLEAGVGEDLGQVVTLRA